MAPKAVRDRFFDESGLTPEDVMNHVYSEPFPNRWLSQQSARLATMLDDPYVYQLVYASIMKFSHATCSVIPRTTTQCRS